MTAWRLDSADALEDDVLSEPESVDESTTRDDQAPKPKKRASAIDVGTKSLATKSYYPPSSQKNQQRSHEKTRRRSRKIYRLVEATVQTELVRSQHLNIKREKPPKRPRKLMVLPQKRLRIHYSQQPNPQVMGPKKKKVRGQSLVLWTQTKGPFQHTTREKPKI